MHQHNPHYNFQLHKQTDKLGHAFLEMGFQFSCQNEMKVLHWYKQYQTSNYLEEIF